MGQTANDAVECILETLFGKRDDDGAEEEYGQASAVWTKRTEGRRFANKADCGGDPTADCAGRYVSSDPNIKKYFSEGRLYYSYLTGRRVHRFHRHDFL